MQDLIKYLILGLIQGIAEWLPISSSGHLAIAKHFLGIDKPISLDIMLHFASLLVILVVFRKDLRQLAKGVLKRDKSSLDLLAFLAIGSIPIAIVGVMFSRIISTFSSNIIYVSLALIITGLMLLMTRFIKASPKELDLISSFLIGIFQAIAIFPGISRSGSTISGAMILGIKKEEAARFSFLLAIPAIFGALIFKIRAIAYLADSDLLLIGASMATAFVSGMLSLNALLGFIKKKGIWIFSFYCLLVGSILLLFNLLL